MKLIGLAVVVLVMLFGSVGVANAQSIQERIDRVGKLGSERLGGLIIDGLEFMIDELEQESPNTSSLTNRDSIRDSGIGYQYIERHCI